MKCCTRGDRTIDLMFCNVKNAYKVINRPPLGNSDHNMLYCMPLYAQKLKSQKCKEINVKQWSDDSLDTLRACFDCTDWDVLLDDCQNLDENVSVCSAYVKFCTDMIIPTKCVTVYPNNKPWVTKEVKEVINKKKYALSNDRSELKQIQKELNVKIHEAKSMYKQKVENLFKTNQTKDAWKGLKYLSGYISKNCIPEPDDICAYVNELNSFYARFDSMNFNAECMEMLDLVSTRICERTVISEEEVLYALNAAKPGKACGPDKISGRVIKACKSELLKPMHKLFQASLDKCEVPSEWKTSETIPVPKIKIPLVMNDLRPVALTSVLMKCFEVIVKRRLCDQVRQQMDSLQFAYREKRCVEDAVTTLLDSVCSHLDKTKTYTRILFIDFSSAFNTIQPHVLLRKLYDMNVNSYLIKWIYSYLTSRPQYVKLNNTMSNLVITNTGAPQGCVLSPVLFTLYTNNCISDCENCTILKYADDTVIIGNIENNNEQMYLNQVASFVNWCDSNYLNLNVKKTMEMFFDFRRNKNDYSVLSIKNDLVRVVNSYKYLGVYIDDQLTFSENVQHLYKKGLQRVHHLRILNNMKIDSQILSMFYKSIVESVLSFSIVTWFGPSSKKDQNKLAKVIKTAKRMGVNVKNLREMYDDACYKMAVKIIKDPSHPLYSKFTWLRSGRRLCVPRQRTNRYSNSFVPTCIKLYNFKANKASKL